MKKQIYLKSLILYLVSFFCSFTQLPAQQPDVLIHYLGHSSFIIQFDNGVKILTDYGTSNSYGLPSPIYDMGHLQPDVVTYSHKHRDHYGREIRVNIPYILQNLDSLNIEGIRIYPIRTCEDNLATESNTSFIFEYKGLTICHLGDAQANIMNINNQTNRDHLKEIFPENIDLLFMTIGFTSNILQQAEKFVALLKPKRIIPMHYWQVQDKASFFSHLEALSNNSEKNYVIDNRSTPLYTFSASDTTTPINVIGLEPAPFIPYDTPDIWYDHHVLNDSQENDNGKAEAGETVSIAITVKNLSLDASQVTATLINDDPDVQILNATFNYGALLKDQQKSNTNNPFTFSVNASSEAHYSTFSLKITADDIFECTDIFQIVIGSPAFLLIDDDCGADYEQYYTKHIFADVWDVSQNNIPSVETMFDYNAVIWYTGDDRETTITAEEQTLISNYLDSGGNLLISGQNIGYDLTADGSVSDLSFFTNYLHAEFIDDSSNTTMTMGTSGDPITSGLFVYLSGNAESANNQNSIDVISPIAPATTILNYIPGFSGAAIRHENVSTGSRLVYLAFGFEGIAGPQSGSANDLLHSILNWFQTNTNINQQNRDKLVPNNFNLYQNYPNPFNANTKIKYYIPENSLVSLKLYNIIGEEVATLMDSQQNAGEYEIFFDAGLLAGGIFIYKLEAGKFVDMKKFILLK